MPAPLAENSAHVNNVVSTEQRLNGEEAASHDSATSATPKLKDEGLSKFSEKIPSKSRTSRRPPSSAMSNEYQHSSSRSRKTGSKSSRDKDSRYAGVVAKQVREKPTIVGSNSAVRKSEITKPRPMKDENPPQTGVNYPQGPILSRVIYTSNRRTRSTGSTGNTVEHLTSVSSPAAVAIVTGGLICYIIFRAVGQSWTVS